MKNSRKCTLLGAAAATAISHAAAQDTEDQSNGLDTIVVTAQFVEQDAQDIPIALTAISGDQLDARGVDNTTLLGGQTPNVQLQAGAASQGNSLIAFIRGVGQQDNAPTLEPGVGIYINDVYFANVQGAQLDLLDLDRVEILRGPQGTLAGKNSIGGAIKMFTKRPDGETDGYIEAAGGSLDQIKIRAASNLTLVDDVLYARVSGAYKERDGHVDTLDFGCLYPGSGVPTARTAPNCKTGTLGGVETIAGRVALRWLPTETLEFNLSADYVDDNSEAPANVLVGTGPTVAPIFIAPPAPPPAPLPLGWPWLNTATVPPTLFPALLDPCVYITSDVPGACGALQQALGGPAITDGYTSFSTFSDPATGFTVDPKSTNETFNISLNIDWDLTDTHQIQSITAYRSYDIFYAQDDDASPVGVSTQSNTQDHKAISQELRLNGALGSSFTYTLGAFFQDTETEIGGRIGLSNSGLDFLVDDIVETTSWALFVNGIWDLTDWLQFAGGIRYSNDEKTFEFDRLNLDGSAPIACAVVPLPGGGFTIDPTSSPNCLVGGINDTPPQVFDDDRLDYRAALSVKPFENSTLYASFSTGYKAGGANSRPFYAAQLAPHGSEEVKSYEIGGKFELFDRTLRLNLAGFFNDYSDVIVTLFNCSSVTGPAFGSPCFLPVNGGEAEVKGFELEFDWAPIDGLVFDGSLGIIDFDYTSVNPASGLTTDTVQPYTPELTWSIGAQYDIETHLGTFSPRLDAVHQDDMFAQPENTPLQLIDGYTLLHASIRWASPDDNWVVGFEARNLTDKYYLTNITDFTGGLNGYATANPGLPRTWLVSLRRNF